MSDARSDAELLSDYSKTGSPQALGELARRHAGLVYSAARRRVGDAHLAEDVTQAVFILLSRKARTIQNPAALVGWLYNTARFAAANAMKMENRRKYHEEQAAIQNHAGRDNGSQEVWSDLMPIIDDAMDQLGQHDRQSILLRYFSGKSVNEVALATGVSEAAAKKRLSRGLEKLRKVLARKGLSIGAGVLVAALSARAAEAAPVALQQMIPTLVTGQNAVASPAALRIAGTVHANPLWTTIAACLGVVITASIIGGSLLIRQQHATAALQTSAPTENQPTHPIAAAAQRWPIQLPGTITGSPTLVDINGDGNPVIIVPAMGMIPRGTAEYTPDSQTDPAAKLYAFHLDGNPVAGWPLTIMTAENHLAARSDPVVNWWQSTPAVLNATATAPSIIVISHPSGPNKLDRGATVIRGNKQLITKLTPGLAMPDPGTTLTLADLQNNGTVGIFGGGTACTADNKLVAGFPAKRVPGGFSASVGDINNNGHLNFFEVTQRHGVSNAVVAAFDSTGKSLPGWPQKIGTKSFAAPSLGNVYGDGKMEIIVPDIRGHILAWTSDGNPFGRTFPEAVGLGSGGEPLTPAQSDQEKCTSIFKDNIDCAGAAALADLDGDGLAEIIVVDTKTSTLRAWHGDGTGFANPDGIIAHLPPSDMLGVSVAGPDENGAFDFFAGNSWVHRDADGLVDVHDMVHGNVPQPTTMPAALDTQCQDTIADLGDGKATILIGTSDGRIILFRTGLKYSPQWAQWPMIGCNPQRRLLALAPPPQWRLNFEIFEIAPVRLNL